ncbi:hypothetical protein B0H17DRAFT_1196887 [Mycena rosella]|uniref:CxC2-like cysteine cluster KDZ transposase-associated domain-containing protein n=1 Tax=Mycena rosella TaxID=1033263 RepID=A0AAD7GMS5_MYCRO|nr:hypothetical protein B0H17DRAFT_1196887 [Mycena rosella]
MAKTKRKAKGLSSHHKVSYGTSLTSFAKNKSIPLNKTGSQIAQKKEDLKNQIAALSFLQRQELFGPGDYDVPMPDAPDYYPADGGEWQDIHSDEEKALHTLPPGEEGYFHSHKGKEADFHRIFDKCKPGRGDPRVRAQRVQKTVDAWNEQMPYLVDAYLELKHDGPVNSDEDSEAWSIDVLGFEEKTKHNFAHASDVQCTNETLLKHGYLGASPEKVSLAFPIRLFEVYRQIHRVCPRYSIGALSTTLTNLHKGPRQPSLAERLSTAYDAYLELVRRVDSRVHAAMGRDNAWYIQNVCAPCLYKVQNEAPLKFSWLACMDGNSSLKLVDATFRSGSVRPDNRASTSFRWLTPAQVDVFKDEVVDVQKKARLSKKKKPAQSTEPATPDATNANTTMPAPSLTPPANADLPDEPSRQDYSRGSTPPSAEGPGTDDDGDVAWLNVDELSGADTDELSKCLNTCVERWKAAGPEARKQMFMLFAIAGIFLTVCRHGHVVIMCDMIRSGELMKYPLAMVRWLLDHYGADVGLGYDIMCAFWKTLKRSSLGADVTAMRLQGVVPAFHGHAHNRPCQIGWHPLYIEGVGLEDFEEFFHRQQQIDEHFQFHDQDKHAASGNFIFQNHRQALEKIGSNRGQLSALEQTLGTTAADYELDHLTEVKYFEGLRTEPPEFQQTADYMELLQKLFSASISADQAKADYIRLDFNIINNGYTKKEITGVRTRYRTSWTKYTNSEEDTARFEEEQGIEIRWAVDSPQYRDALVLSTERRYWAAISEVERLVVQRLFELTKLGMSGVAYKLRDKISKALKTRSDAIRRAISIYNDAGAALNPPRERLTFADIIHTTSLAEFDLLRETRVDIREQAWTQPARREAGVLYFGIKRAKEEIGRLNIEISRVITYLVDEHVDYYLAIAAALIVNPPLAAELQQRWLHASRISTSICKRLASTARFTGFSGTLFPGVREGRVTETEVEYNEGGGGDFDLERDYNEQDEAGLVVRELDIDEDGIVELMEHLSTFQDV